jgi:hypothetical protein
VTPPRTERPAREAARLEVLREVGASPAEAEELLRYNDNAFAVPAALDLPLPDEPFVAAWEEYTGDAALRGVAAALRERLPQLRFPVEAGISGTPEYLAATRQGILPEAGAPGLALEAPERVRLFLHPTAAGRIPVVLAERRADFVALVRALCRRNEPAAVPDSQGAAMVAGYNNWDRVARLRADFEAGRLSVPGAQGWAGTLQALRGRKELYQDCFILLSGGPYSGVAAADVGLPDDEWRCLSTVIRLEHECAHYFTRRVFGSMRNTLLDELIADYAGITAAAGAFRADWFLRFLGLESPDSYREGGRLENYRGDPPLTPGALRALQALVRRAALAVQAADRAIAADVAASGTGTVVRARVMAALAAFTLEELALDGAADRLAEAARHTAASGTTAPIDRAMVPSGAPPYAPLG